MVWKTRYGPGAVLTYRGLIDPLISPLRPKITRICFDLKAGNVLDIASGTGAQCRRLHQVGIQATGIDFAEPMITAARRHSDSGIRFVHGSAYELPFEDDAFDACLLVLALHEHPEANRTVMIEEAFRVMRPGGHLIVADFCEPAHPALHVPWQVIRLIENTAGDEHNAGFRDFVSRGCLAGLIERHGLTASHTMPSHFGTIGIAIVRP
ncbi:MAG: class I SAM-dependent methyltransferase [Candidatus Bipolaricaulia bacterium]